jgi:hypothetical protein
MVLLSSLGLLVAACKGEESAPAAEAPAAPAAEPAAEAPKQGAAMATQPPPIPPGARVFFVEPAADATIRGPLVDGRVEVAVKMGAEGMTIKPVPIVEAGAGHHHIIIDGAGKAQSEVVPADEQHLHFGKGQTEAKLQLTPGKHTLTLQLADGLHRSYGPKLSATISINVEAEGEAPAAAKEGEGADEAAAEEGEAAPKQRAAPTLPE